jgi:hypothetical protein
VDLDTSDHGPRLEEQMNTTLKPPFAESVAGA